MVKGGQTQEFVFQSAVDFLESKEAVPMDIYTEMDDKTKARAFSVSRYTTGEVLNQFLQELADAVNDGTTKAAFQEKMNDFLERNGYDTISPWHADVIFRTNVQTAYQAGHYENMMEAKEFRPYWQYKTAGDGSVRESHMAMEGKVYAADDPIWNIWYPPNGFRCRCIVVSLSKRQLEKRHLTVATSPPTDLGTGKRIMMPDKGFSNNPATTPWHPDTSSFNETLRGLIKEKPVQGGE